MRRLYFLVPDAPLARALVGELLQAGLPAERVHALSRQPLDLEQLPAEAEVHHDLRHKLEHGAAAGGTVGALAGLAALAMPGGLVLAGGAILALAVTGAGVGAVVATLTGHRAEDPELRHFEAALDRGELLLLVDVERPRVEEFEALVQKMHPQVRIAGTDPGATFP